MPIYHWQNSETQKKIVFLFIHIPKTGGSTLAFFFKQLGFRSFGAPKEYFFVRDYLKCPPSHFDMKIIEQLFKLEAIYSFAITRDPLKRLFSDYKWAQTKSKNIDKFMKMSFEDFVNDSFEKYSLNEYYLANHIKPQHHFISDKVTRVFKLEDGLENAIKTVFNDLQIKLINDKNKNAEMNLPYLNKSQPYSKDLEINDNTIKMIKDFYKEDYTKFGYKL